MRNFFLPAAGLSAALISSGCTNDVDDVYEGFLRASPNAAACTVFLAENGDDARAGRRPGAPKRTIQAAVQTARDGDVICLAPGVYPGSRFSSTLFDDAAGLTLRAAPGARHEAVIDCASGGTRFTGLTVSRATDITVEGLAIRNCQFGILYKGVTRGRIADNHVQDIGNSAISVGAFWDDDGVMGPVSSFIEIVDNTVENAGTYEPAYGEGVYIGTGHPSKRGDHTHDILIENNDINRTSQEAVDLKRYTYNTIVRGNRIGENNAAHNGAITVNDNGECADEHVCRHIIENNVIYNHQPREWHLPAILVGWAPTVVRNNVVFTSGAADVHPRGGMSYANGIAVKDEVLEAPNGARVLIERNTLWSTQEDSDSVIYDAFRVRLRVTLRDNLTFDGAYGQPRADANDFVGPITGTADTGRGPGSGFATQLSAGADVRLIYPQPADPASVERSAS